MHDDRKTRRKVWFNKVQVYKQSLAVFENIGFVIVSSKSEKLLNDWIAGPRFGCRRKADTREVNIQNSLCSASIWFIQADVFGLLSEHCS